jgi:hypothetical protein
MSPVRYELGFYILEDEILHSHRRENLQSYINMAGFMRDIYQQLGRNPVPYFLMWTFHCRLSIRPAHKACYYKICAWKRG